MRNRPHRFVSLTNNKTRGITVLAILLIIFNVIVFAIPFDRSTPIFWIAYVFATVAIAAQYGVSIVAFRNAKTLRSRILGFPIFEIGFFYMIVQFIFSIGLIIAGKFYPEMNTAIALVPCVVLAGLAAIFILIVDSGRDEIERQDEAIREDTAYIRLLTADVNALLPRATDDESKIALGKLADALRYSDPAHVEGLEAINAEISQTFLKVKTAVTSGEGVAEPTAEMMTLLNERSEKAKALKRLRL